jgi:hypothetical protein
MMKYNLLISLCFLVLIKSPAQTASPLEVVQAQLDAYNAQDIDSFTAVFCKRCGDIHERG